MRAGAGPAQAVNMGPESWIGLGVAWGKSLQCWASKPQRQTDRLTPSSKEEAGRQVALGTHRWLEWGLSALQRELQHLLELPL